MLLQIVLSTTDPFSKVFNPNGKSIGSKDGSQPRMILSVFVMRCHGLGWQLPLWSYDFNLLWARFLGQPCFHARRPPQPKNCKVDKPWPWLQNLWSHNPMVYLDKKGHSSPGMNLFVIDLCFQWKAICFSTVIYHHTGRPHTVGILFCWILVKHTYRWIFSDRLVP